MTAAGLFEWPALLPVLPGTGGPARLGAITTRSALWSGSGENQKTPRVPGRERSVQMTSDPIAARYIRARGL